jgi:hypothetical protein
MHSPAQIDAAGRVRTTDLKQRGTIYVSQDTSVARKSKKKISKTAVSGEQLKSWWKNGR